MRLTGIAGFGRLQPELVGARTQVSEASIMSPSTFVVGSLLTAIGKHLTPFTKLAAQGNHTAEAKPLPID